MASSLDDYAEVAIQYGYNGLFLSALPMASLFGFVANVIEVWNIVYVFKLLL